MTIYGLRETIEVTRERHSPLHDEYCPVCKNRTPMYSLSRIKRITWTRHPDATDPDDPGGHKIIENGSHDFLTIRCLRCMTEFDRTLTIPSKLVSKETK